MAACISCCGAACPPTKKEIVVTITPPAGQGRNYSNIMAAAWSQQDGQDDLVWYNATANGDGTYTIRVPMCKYNVVGGIWSMCITTASTASCWAV